jgi:signal transduction histidine kinase
MSSSDYSPQAWTCRAPSRAPNRPEITARLTRTIDDLQTTIDEIRTRIFALQPPAHCGGGFQLRVRDAVSQLTDNRDNTTSVLISGPIDVVRGQLADHAEAVITEAISNSIRHSGATTIVLAIDVTDELTIDIVDNGCGIAADNQRRSGPANLYRRAERVCGRRCITSPPNCGTRVHWTAALVES